ncbi:dihydrodipicolinate reductase C-terminal domain-containing protein [Candidatus Vidania fulgoroideorum]
MKICLISKGKFIFKIYRFLSNLKKIKINIINKFNKKNIKIIKKCNLIIDFSYYIFFLKTLKLSYKYNKKIIIGTTNLKNKKILKRLSKKIFIFISSNYNFEFIKYLKVIKYINFIFKKYNYEILEKHHILKSNKPSGSSIYIKNILSSKINIIRIGKLRGIHKIFFANYYNTFSFSHTTLCNKTYLINIFKVIYYIYNYKRGLYFI